MSRIASTLLLALLLVCAQQAALLHEIGHGTGHGATGPLALARGASAFASAAAADRGGTKGEVYCDQCFQFAHVCAAVFSCAPAFVALAAVNETAFGMQAADLPAEVPQTRSRGPPVVL